MIVSLAIASIVIPVIDYWAQTEIVNRNLDRICMPTKSVSVLVSQIKEPVLTELDNEIECPRCHEDMESYSQMTSNKRGISQVTAEGTMWTSSPRLSHLNGGKWTINGEVNMNKETVDVDVRGNFTILSA